MEIPHALVKDLRSTGYFYNELKSYSQSPEIDLAQYCSNLAIPYLVKASESLDRRGRPDGSKIFRFAIQQLSNPGDLELVQTIFGLKKVAELESITSGKACIEGKVNKPGFAGHSHRLESAEFLLKLLVNIIKMFRLTEPARLGQRTFDEPDEPAGDAVMQEWELQGRGC